MGTPYAVQHFSSCEIPKKVGLFKIKSTPVIHPIHVEERIKDPDAIMTEGRPKFTLVRAKGDHADLCLLRELYGLVLTARFKCSSKKAEEAKNKGKNTNR